LAKNCLRQVELQKLYCTNAPTAFRKIHDVDISEFPPEKIRNFCIIAHIDHGKSTLADRILELVGAISKSSDNKQVLDKLQVERERGITVKANSASVVYSYDDKEFILNLIDTPGHVDFSYEVTRSLRACQGVLLLVDANSGVQAQTVSNFYQAFAANLEIIPVINKIDLPAAKPEVVKQQLQNLFDIEPKDVLLASGKLGIGVKEILDAVVERVPPIKTDGPHGNTRAFLFDSWFDQYQGAINLIQVVDGVLRLKNIVVSNKTGCEYTIKTLGLLTPERLPQTALYPGQIGYFTCNMRSTKEAIIGDTFSLKDKPTESLIEIDPAKPMVFAGVYPFNPSEHPALKRSIEKLVLNDASVTVNMESSPVLGLGWRLGFLGILHMEVFRQRLENEFDADVVVTTPSVPYKVVIKGESNIKKLGKEIVISNPADWITERSCVERYMEPTVLGTIITPTDYFSSILELCNDRRAEQKNIENIDQTRLNMQFVFPLGEIATNFYDDLKSLTSGYASFDYEDYGYQESDLVRLDVALNGENCQELSSIVHSSKVRVKGKQIVFNLKQEVPRQQFNIAIQAKVGSKIVAREDLKALKKDVTAKCYGGDISRKMKLLKHQAEGKKRMKRIGNVEVSKETFIKVLTK